jgi:2-polyprenyl-6-methoxyphenol hydroxylase-like FAD-dependent oxidoreductase
MTLPHSTDVFVIGGGPAGLAAAIAARRHGFRVTVADCSIPPIDKACGEGLMPDGVAAARALGIDLDMAPAQRFSGIRFCDGGACVEARFPRHHGLGMRRTALHRVLIEHAADIGVNLAWGTHVTGIGDEGVRVAGRLVRTRWTVGADGHHSPVRRWAGLEASHRDSRRFGFRRHYRLAPWSEFMEIHWGDAGQLYLTPVAEDEICAVWICADPRLRLDDALPYFPAVAARLGPASALPSGVTAERGGVSASRRLKSVYRGRVALVGDASGSVDAVTGEGLCLLFQQSAALASAMAADDLSLYQTAHQRMGRRPRFMSDLLLSLGNSHRLRRRAIRVMAAQPALFGGMLAMHVGELSSLDFLRNGLSLGWNMVTL